MAVPSKRKAKLGASNAHKRIKTAEELPWKALARPSQAGYNDAGMDGIMDLEEVDDVEVIYEQTETGRVARFNVLEAAKDSLDDDDDEAEPGATGVRPHTDPESSDSDDQEAVDDVDFDSETLLPAWHPYHEHIHPSLLQALHNQNFTSPTPIQQRALTAAANSKDIIGVAETGSGKTLAYGLPILHHLLTQPKPKKSKGKSPRRRLQALIIAPTRELALQVSTHLNACLKSSTETENGTQTGKKQAPRVSVAAVVGGMSAQKQRRILDRGVDVLVATPGRLWDIIEEDDVLAGQIRDLRFLVLDEADRMVEAGHFAELDNILRLTLRNTGEEMSADFIAADPASPPEAQEGIGEVEKTGTQMQTFVFSATMSKDLQRNLKKRKAKEGKGKGKGGKDKQPASTLDDLLLRLDFRDPEPEVIDLSPEGGAVSTLKQSLVECLATDKDFYLYYFLLRYPGRSLVFLSSVDGLRRLTPLMELLEIKAFPLHSQLEQRQRLKNLDRFRSTPNAVLLATDVAARGLDIPAVDHVIHYQVPRSADVYVHRNGRTARAQREGFSLLMCAPDERRLFRALWASLGREDEIPEMGVDMHMLDKIKARVQLARRIDSARHKVQKANHEKKWMREAAEAMELELGSDFESGGEDESGGGARRVRGAAKVAGLRAELKGMLARPLLAQGVSARYITSGARPIAEEMVKGGYHETMVGLKKAGAGSELALAKKKKAKQERRAVDDDGEVWGGISV